MHNDRRLVRRPLSSLLFLVSWSPEADLGMPQPLQPRSGLYISATLETDAAITVAGALRNRTH